MSTRLPMASKQFSGMATGLLQKSRIYLDNACLTPVPRQVVAAIHAHYEQPPGCPLRNGSTDSTRLEHRIREARDTVRHWLNAKFSDEIAFTLNTTASIQLLAGAFASQEGAVLLTDAEHNSNRLPWLHQARVELPWAPGTSFPMDTYRRLLREQRIKLVSISALSNVTGASIPIAEVVMEAHQRGVPVHLDAAQAAAHRTIDITEQEPDFLSLSLHKAYGPSGLGVLYVRRDKQEAFIPHMLGGGTVDDHEDERTVVTHGPARYEAGLQNYASISAVPETVAFHQQFQQPVIQAHFEGLNRRLQERLQHLPGLHIVGSSIPAERHHIFNFYLDQVDSMRLAELLDLTSNVQVRAGRMCAHHYYHHHQLPNTVRVSFGYHNTIEEVERYGDALEVLLERYIR